VNQNEKEKHMHNYVKFRMECLGRVAVFGQKTDIVFTPDETPLFASVGAAVTALKGAGAKQADGRRGFREGTKQRRIAAKDLRIAMRDIAEVATAIDEAEIEPGIAERFRMPVTGLSFEALAAVARGFVEAAEPRKALFIANGLVATFVEDLTALITLVGNSGNARETGRSTQVGGTASLETVAEQGMKKVRQLRARMRVKLRNDPALLAEWVTAARVHRARIVAKAVAPRRPRAANEEYTQRQRPRRRGITTWTVSVPRLRGGTVHVSVVADLPVCRVSAIAGRAYRNDCLAGGDRPGTEPLHDCANESRS
jgi:hypothetical protein